VERLIGDRNSDLVAIVDREWDAVFDLATYVPSSVRRLGEALNGCVGHYTFISSGMVYKFPGATDESSEVLPYEGALDPYEATSVEFSTYGPFKSLCEREGERCFPGRTLVLRPGHIVGPREALGAFTYLIARMQRGGEVLAIGDLLTQVQLIDVRDLADWAISMAERGEVGAFNAVGPAAVMGWAELLGAVRSVYPVATKLTWVPIDWALDRRVRLWSPLLFWPAEFGVNGFTRLSNSKAVAHLLRFRPLQDTLAWYHGLPAERQRVALLQFDENTTVLEDMLAREAELLAAWHAGHETARSVI
jgi:2'-hydroxyisoflavone reductase